MKIMWRRAQLAHPAVRRRLVLGLLAIVVLVLCANAGKSTFVFAQESPTPTPTFFFPTPFVPTPFGTPPGPPLPPVFTPTPTPDMRVVNEIVHPKTGDAVAGFAPIVGTAVINDFVQYQVHISPTGAENWSWLTTSRKVVRNNLIYLLNTYQLQDGFYDLRVRAIDRGGNYSESFLRRIEVRNANPPTATPIVNEFGTPQPASPLVPPSNRPPTATPTPIFQSFVENGQGIFEPRNGEVVAGLVTVVGTVNGKSYLNPFERYELYVMPTGGTEWNWLYSGAEQFWQSPIYTWDTTQLADGFYDLRLRIVYRDGNYDEYYVSRLRIANQSAFAPGKVSKIPPGGTVPGIYFPLDGAMVSGIMDLVGTTDVPNLLNWEVYWSQAGAEEWTFLVSDGRPLVNSTLARLDLGLLPAGSYDFRLRIVRHDYRYTDYHVRGVQATPPTPTPIPTAP
jgi:hypothetical protein